eukprot:4699413-Lingulodinium_polyedra.AAC.1
MLPPTTGYDGVPMRRATAPRLIGRPPPSGARPTPDNRGPPGKRRTNAWTPPCSGRGGCGPCGPRWAT